MVRTSTRLLTSLAVAVPLLFTPAIDGQYNHDNRDQHGNHSQFYQGAYQGGRGGAYDQRQGYDRGNAYDNRGYENHGHGIGPGGGAAIGGAGGAVLGAVFGGGLKGALIGGAAGAGIGALVGQEHQQNERRNDYR